MNNFKRLLEQDLNEATIGKKFKKTVSKAVNYFKSVVLDNDEISGKYHFAAPYKEISPEDERKLQQKAYDYNLFINSGLLVHDNKTKKWWEVDLGWVDLNQLKNLRRHANSFIDDNDTLYNFITGIGYEADIEDFCKKILKTDKFAIQKNDY